MRLTQYSLPACLLLAALTFACNKSSNQSTQVTAKRYHLKGKVVSIDKKASIGQH